jgi:hypothetical protein
MNSNFIRSVLNVLSIISVAMVALGGCVGDDPATAIIEATKCEAAWLPPQVALIAALVFQAIGFGLKMFGSHAGPIEALTKPVAVVTPDTRAGTVTPAQVASGPKV